MTPYTPNRRYEVTWSGALETAATKAQQRPAVRVPPELMTGSELADLRGEVLAFLRARPGASTQAIVDRLHIERRRLGDALYTLERGDRALPQ